MIVVIGLSMLIGLSLGILGGGGSILTLPILVYVVGLDEKPAIATSLLVVGVTSAVAAIFHARAGNVRWKIAAAFSSAAAVGAYAGGQVGRFIPGRVLLTMFALLMLAMAAAMWRGRGRERQAGPDANSRPNMASFRRRLIAILVQGTAVGFTTGLVGAGGGFLIVPALVLFDNLPIHQAVGTSLVVIALNSFAGFLGYLHHVSIDVPTAAIVTTAAATGSLMGSLVGRYVPQGKLRRAFSMFVVGMAVFLLYKQLPR